MSFYSNNRNGIFPGSAVGNITNGLCERVCIQTNKVFDACMSQMELENLTITITTYTPENPVFPITFVSASSTGVAPTVQNLVITRFDDRPNFSRIQCNVVIPVQVNYVDNNGASGVGTGTITVAEDVVMYVPQPALVPFTVTAFANVVATSGVYSDNNVFTVSACASIILKVIAEVDILVPSYGYCPIPPCTPYAGENVCPGVFQLPVFPTAVSPTERRT